MGDIAVVNAWLIHKEMAGTNGQGVLTQLEVRKELADALRQDFMTARVVRAAGHNPDLHGTAFSPVPSNQDLDVPASMRATKGLKNCFRCYDEDRKESKTAWK